MATLAEQIAERQRAKLDDNVGSTYWDPQDVKGLEKLLCVDQPEGARFVVAKDEGRMAVADYAQGTTLLVLYRMVKVMRKDVKQKVTLYESGRLVGTGVNLKGLIPNA